MTENPAHTTLSSAFRFMMGELVSIKREMARMLAITCLTMGIILITYAVSKQIFPILGTPFLISETATDGMTFFPFVGFSILVLFFLISLPFTSYFSKKSDIFCPLIYGATLGLISIDEPWSIIIPLMVIAGVIGLINSDMVSGQKLATDEN